MKKNYSNAEIEIIRFTAEDIVTASSTGETFDYVDKDGWD